MAIKLDRAAKNERSERVSKLEEAYSQLENAVSEFNEKLTDLRTTLKEQIDLYNHEVQEAQTFVEGVTNTAEQEYDEKSERWQDSDKGQAADSWISEWGSVDLEEITEELPGDFSIDAFTPAADPLNALPEAPEDV